MQLISVDAAKKNEKSMKVHEAGLNRNGLEQFVAFGLDEHIGASSKWLIVCEMYYCNNEKYYIFHWNSPGVQVSNNLALVMGWLGTKQAKSYYLNKKWPSL